MCQRRIGDSGDSEQQAATGATLMLLPAARLNGCIVLGVSSACMQQWGGLGVRVGVTYVTAYCAKDRYSTSTSRPLLSSFKNSLTHLETQKESRFNNLRTRWPVQECV